jgi:hypothetical protein
MTAGGSGAQRGNGAAETPPAIGGRNEAPARGHNLARGRRLFAVANDLCCILRYLCFLNSCKPIFCSQYIAAALISLVSAGAGKTKRFRRQISVIRTNKLLNYPDYVECAVNHFYNPRLVSMVNAAQNLYLTGILESWKST